MAMAYNLKCSAIVELLFFGWPQIHNTYYKIPFMDGKWQKQVWPKKEHSQN